MEIRELPSIDAVAAEHWNALHGTDCPFLRHEFLAALEHNGCVGASKGWTPAHLALFENGRLCAAAPVYRKHHSWGEFVFDFGWAQAYSREGLDYYPKLLCAVPFSPVNAMRLLTARSGDPTRLRHELIKAFEQCVTADRLSSAHALFVDPAEQSVFADRGWLLRQDVQFHWHNAGYGSFDDYLGTMQAEKRKKLKRERRRCAEAGITFDTLGANELTPALLDFVFQIHAATFHRHGHEPYLNRAFFGEIAVTLGDALMIKLARLHGEPVAAAVFFHSAQALYGRYWGALEAHHSLHFEACYHQGIEFCIKRGIQRFEPGTQGEHKVARGFAPTTTWSAHFIADPRFRTAIAAFVTREANAVDTYAQEVGAHLPFRHA